MLRGGCHCGSVRYEATAAPFHETICHCADCRRIAGAASVGWFSVPLAAFRYTAQAPVVYRSSPGVERSHCGGCGTALTFWHEAFADEIDVTIASLDDPDTVPPKDHGHVREKLGWDVIGDALPRLAGARGDG